MPKNEVEKLSATIRSRVGRLGKIIGAQRDQALSLDQAYGVKMDAIALQQESARLEHLLEEARDKQYETEREKSRKGGKHVL